MKSNKRTASQALEDEGEQQRFSEVVQKRLKLEDDPAARKQRRVDKEKEIAKERGVIYVGHIPHGFYEDELRKYFSQFGEVTRVRVSRSRKTGGSRGFAFVEFQSDAVAAIAAETMNGYLMFDRLLKVHVVPKEKVHADMFALRYPFPLNREITRTFINMERTETRDKRSKKLRVQRFKKQIQHLQNLGISYEGKMKVSDGSKVCPKQFKPSKKEVEPVQHTLLLDSDDDEIQFKTPPNTVKKPKHPKHQSTPAGGETKKTPITVTPKAKTQKKTPLKQTPSAKKLKSPKGKRLSSL